MARKRRPANLPRKHQALDLAVDRVYRRVGWISECEHVEHLLMLYEKMQAPLAFALKSKRPSRRRNGPVLGTIQ